MEELGFLVSMVSIILSAGICSVIFNKLKLPPIIGYLIAGILLANFTTVTSESHQIVEILSDMGLVMLMFCIGMELNLEKLKRNGKFAMLVAIIQLPLMVMIGFFCGSLLGLGAGGAIALGGIISGSSTAVVAAVLKMQERITKEEAETLILVTVMEDIGQVIILSMITPIFVGSSVDPMGMVALVGMIVAFMVISLLVGIKFVPRILNWVGNNTSAEVLLIFSIGLCFGLAYLSVSIGLSMAIGSFLMGVVVSQSTFSEHLLEKVEPMKDLFMAIFFISIGFEISIQGFINSLDLAIIIFIIFAISKFSTVFLGYFVGNKSYTDAFVSAVSLMAMGEFAFIIAKEAFDHGAVTAEFYTAVIGAALISMIVLPLISKKMFNVVDHFNKDCPTTLARAGSSLLDVRQDIYDLISPRSVNKDLVLKSLRNSYILAVLVIVIEFIMIGITDGTIEFFRELFTFTEYGNAIAYILFMLINFTLLAIPIKIVISNIKHINLIILEDKEFKYSKHKEFYNGFYKFSSWAIVFIIDFAILFFVPGPFGATGSFYVVPIIIIVFLIAWFFNKAKKDERRMKKAAKKAEKNKSDDEESDE